MAYDSVPKMFAFGGVTIVQKLTRVKMPYFCARSAQKYGISYPGKLLYDGDAPKCKRFWHAVLFFFCVRKYSQKDNITFSAALD